MSKIKCSLRHYTHISEYLAISVTAHLSALAGCEEWCLLFTPKIPLDERSTSTPTAHKVCSVNNSPTTPGLKLLTPIPSIGVN